MAYKCDCGDKHPHERPVTVTGKRRSAVQASKTKWCYHCLTWSNVYAEQTICPKCNHEGLRER